jgi:MFS family permease
LLFFRFALITVPITYALASSMTILIAVSAFWGIAQAANSASVAAYLLDVSPEEYRGSFIALFNLIIGIVTFLGSLIAGYLADYVIGLYDLVLGLQIVYAVSMVGRIISAVLHLALKETLKPTKTTA